jgi:hypothetical protein
MKCLYVFVDESGNLDFTPKGTKYFVLSAITATTPIKSSNILQGLKYDLLAEGSGGSELECFHASEDSQAVRNAVFEKIATLDSIHINYIIAEKRKTNPSRQGANFYRLLGSALTKYLLLKYRENNEYRKIVIVFDQVLPNKERGNFLKEIKPILKAIGKPYAIYFHKMISDFNGQIADYCAWAKYVELERGELRPMEAIENISKDVFDIFSSGDRYYY